MPEKILLVDDDLDTLRLVGLMLQRQGYEILAANHGLQALELAQTASPDLILLDVMMPEMDGYEVARRLRSEPVTADIPIIMFTAKAQVDDKLMGFEAGADAYLTKPTQPRELFAHMKAVLARASKSRPAEPAAAIDAAPERGYLIGVISARGGVGVSTLALNLGLKIQEACKKSTIVAEFRPGQGSIGMELGFLKPEGLNRLTHLQPAEITPKDMEAALLTHASGVRLLLASHQPRDAHHLLNVPVFEAIARHLSLLARYVVIDLGPALTPINEKVVQLCDEVIVVVEPSPNAVRQSRALIEDLISQGIGEGRLNTVMVNRVRSGVQLSWNQVQDQLGRQISVIFTPAPELAYQASTNNVAMVAHQPDSLTSQQFAKLAERVVQRSR